MIKSSVVLIAFAFLFKLSDSQYNQQFYTNHHNHNSQTTSDTPNSNSYFYEWSYKNPVNNQGGPSNNHEIPSIQVQYHKKDNGDTKYVSVTKNIRIDQDNKGSDKPGFGIAFGSWDPKFGSQNQQGNIQNIFKNFGNNDNNSSNKGGILVNFDLKEILNSLNKPENNNWFYNRPNNNRNFPQNEHGTNGRNNNRQFGQNNNDNDNFKPNKNRGFDQNNNGYFGGHNFGQNNFGNNDYSDNDNSDEDSTNFNHFYRENFFEDSNTKQDPNNSSPDQWTPIKNPFTGSGKIFDNWRSNQGPGFVSNDSNASSVLSIKKLLTPAFDLGVNFVNLLVEAQQDCGLGVPLDSTETSIRIARGSPASEMYPWLVAINQAAPGKKMEFICGGSLITTKHVVSAAHCFLARESNQYQFIVSNNRLLNADASETNVRTADRIMLHPGYNPHYSPANADVAVVTFRNPVQFGPSIRPICLWRGDTDIRGLRGLIGRVVGWGADENLHLADDMPMEINMGILDYTTCISKDNSFVDIVGENSFCTGYRNGSGPCMGDSGSGFMLKQDGRWSLRGVVSLTTRLVACDINNYVGLTDVAKYLTWIAGVIRQ